MDPERYPERYQNHTLDDARWWLGSRNYYYDYYYYYYHYNYCY